MSAFIRRFTDFPSLQTLTEIEAVNIIDLAPQAVFLGVGSGTVLNLGEFEDGPFATGGDSPYYVNPSTVETLGGRTSQPILEVFGDVDAKKKYGGFGFTHDGLPSSSPCARQRMGEFWNGNGYLKMKGLRAQRLMLARVDTSVGVVSFSPLASLVGTERGPFPAAAGQTISFTTQTGGPTASTALAAVAAILAGSSFANSGFVGGEQIGFAIDGGSPVIVTFLGSDQTPTQVAARINATFGATIATVAGGGVTLTGFQLGTGGRVQRIELTTGALAAIGMTAGTTNGTGNVSNIAQVTAAEIATIINGTAGLGTIGVAAVATSDGRLKVYQTGLVGGTLQVTAGALQALVGLATTSVAAGAHGGGTIPAGTRVRTAGGAEWVTMQTMTLLAGSTFAGGKNIGPHDVKVRPSNDVPGQAGAGVGAANVLVDQPGFAMFAVTNPAALSVALTDPVIDTRYGDALEVTRSINAPTRVATFLMTARRSPTVVMLARQNVIETSSEGCFGRKLITRAPLAYDDTQSLADVAQYRSDRVYYTTIPFRLYASEIAIRGAAGGVGFTENGVIDVGGETALATICAMLAPEEDPGQQTALLSAWIGLGAIGADYSIETYTAFRAAGICAPRADSFSGLFFQSGVTTSLEPGRTEINRRNMADFVQDSLSILALPYCKKLPTNRNKSSFVGDLDSFLSGLKSEQDPDRARIRNYRIDAVSGNTLESESQGIFRVFVYVQTFESMKYIEIPVEIGSSVVITDLAA